jgi:hypothetical protein
LRATVAGSIRSSARSLSPSRLVAAASDIDAERIGSASWISGERTTTSMLVSSSASSHTSSVTPGAAVSAGSDATPAVLSASGTTPYRHGFGDHGSLDWCSCQHKTHGISTRGL